MDRGIYIAGFGFSAIMACLFFAISALPHLNDLPIGLQQTKYLVWLGPQRWDFFSRDPRGVIPSVYVWYTKGGWKRVEPRADTTAWNAFGFGRRRRLIGLATGRLTFGLPNEAWTPCGDDGLDDCLKQVPYHASLSLSRFPKELCGDIALVSRPIVPWAWSRNRAKPMPAKLVKFHISCLAPVVH